VPVSLFLSGGIDSSALLSLAGQVGAREIRTFAVGFREAEFDEQGYAEMVARHYGAEHTTIQLTEAEVLMKLPAALRALDQPSIDGLNTWIVAEATRSAGMKVALSGLGGDEAFLGYRLFQTIERDERRRGWLERVPGPLRELAGELIGRLARNHGSTRLSELVRNGQVNIPTARLRRELFSPRQRMELLAAWPEGNEPEGNEMEGAARQELQEWLRRQIRNCARADPINRAAAFELGGYLSNTLLRDTDVMSMAHGLEVRVPLLDHPLLERLLQIDGATRLGRGARSAKWLLVEAAGDLPHAVTSRRKKGFELPFAPWLRGPLRGLVEEALSSTALAGVIDRAAGLRIWNDFLVGRTSWSRVWALVVLSRWIELHPEQKV
jgi:asparagine synthase (glutamine-hydrolysing)